MTRAAALYAGRGGTAGFREMLHWPDADLQRVHDLIVADQARGLSRREAGIRAVEAVRRERQVRPGPAGDAQRAGETVTTFELGAGARCDLDVLVDYRGDRRALATHHLDGPLTTEEIHRRVLDRLPGPEQRLLRPLLEAYPASLSNEQLAEPSGIVFLEER